MSSALVLSVAPLWVQELLLAILPSMILRCARTIAGLTLSSVRTSTFGPHIIHTLTVVFIPSLATGVGLEIRTSPDRTAWTLRGLVWPNGASWTDPYTGTTNGALWAPDCTYINGVFYVRVSYENLKQTFPHISIL